MAGRFDNKVVMITGAGGAIARAVVRQFANEGAKLILVDRDNDALKACVDALSGVRSDYLLVGGDLGKPDDVDAIIRQAEEKFGSIHALAHTAGGFAAGDPVHEADISVFEKQMYLNARLVYLTLGRVAKHMVDNGVKGSLVAVLARTGLGGAKNTAAYAASKAAAQRIVESMALELNAHDIRVNGVMPSTADTPANREAMSGADFSKWVTPQQLAEAIIFLSSDAASGISGQSLGVYNKA